MRFSPVAIVTIWRGRVCCGLLGSGEERRGKARHYMGCKQPIALWQQSAFGWRHHEVWSGTARRGEAWQGGVRHWLSTAVSASCAFTEADSFTGHVSVRSGTAGPGAASPGMFWPGLARAVNSGKGSVSNGGFIEADSFTRMGWVRQGATGHGLARHGHTDASSIACGVWGCGKHLRSRRGKAGLIKLRRG